MSWVDEKDRYEDIIEEIEPASIITTKDHWFWTVLWWTAVVFTLGLFVIGMPKKRFLEEYATTFFPIQGYPSIWEALSTRLLVHECRHTTHCVWLGYLVPILGWIPGKTGRHIRAWCGAPFYAVLYLLVVFPIGFSVGRWLIEFDADRTSWKWQAKYGYKLSEIVDRARGFGKRVCSGRYMWAWLRVFGGVALFEWAAKRIVKE